MATLAFVMAMHGRMAMAAVLMLEDVAQRRGWHVPRRRAKLIISFGVVEGELERLLDGKNGQVMDRFGGIRERAKLTVNEWVFVHEWRVAADIGLDCGQVDKALSRDNRSSMVDKFIFYLGTKVSDPSSGRDNEWVAEL